MYRTLGSSKVMGCESQSESQSGSRPVRGSQSEQNNAAKRSSARMPSANHHFKLTKFSLIETGAENSLDSEKLSVEKGSHQTGLIFDFQDPPRKWDLV